MRNKKILQKAAKKSLSWLLILGMLVTLPETPGAISAAAAELETGTEETVHEESGDADRMEETKNAVTEKTGETETKADTAVQEETGTSQSQETKEPETETQDAEAENEDAETEDAEAAVTEAETQDAETEAPVTETTEDETELSEETEETETEQEVKAVEGAMNLTLHMDNSSAKYKTPALQFWGDDNTIVSGATEKNQEITGWEDAVGQLLTADKDGKFYSVTLNGNFTGFQFLDYADPSKNTAGQGFVSTMKSYTGDTPTDLYYICKDGNWGWYLDAAGTEALKEPELVYLTMHIKPETKWSKPAMQHWNDKLTITDTKGQETITGWDVKGDLFTAEENGFYKLTVKGTFGGFQFVDVDNADDTKTGDNTYDKLLDKFVAETPTDVYYIQKDGTWNWYMDKDGTITLASTKEVSDQAVDNADGTTTFTAVAENVKDKVKVVYGKKSEVEEKGTSALKTVTMTADKSVANAYTTDAIFLGDDALDIVYYIEVDGVKKDIETSAGVTVGKDTYLSYTRDKFTGRMVCIPGTFPGKSWDAASNIMTYMGEGLYSYTFKNVPAANYEYKIALGDWSENYGAGGVISGSNIAVTVTEPQDVTIYYSDFSHYSKCSIDYKFGASLLLQGTGILADTRFSDSRLTGIYSATVENMEAGTYSDTKIVSEDETVEMDPYTVDTTKDVTFYYDPESGIYYSNASDKEVATNKLVFDSKDTAYKSVYGAVATGEEVTYSIDTGDDVTAVKLVVKGVEKKTLSMKKTAGAEDGKQRWSVTTSYDRLGEYQYFFAVYNETAVVMYGDDDGFYGTGVAANLLNLLPYDQIVYQSGYETPDWMKNAVIYQIFPDRFYNGDVTNDTITSDARGSMQYEYMNDWYILPENPEQVTLHPDTYPTYAYKGDGNWSNEIYGGDLKGITKRIDYLKALGVTVIYLNPVFESISSHRYDTSDYKNIDPILGTLGDFEELVSVAEANNMHVVLDGVFNHVSDDSVYFDRYYEYLEDGTDTIGAYPYWAYVYDAMSEKKISKEEAEKQAKEYFTAEYGITNYDYTEWFDVFSDTTLKDDNDDEVCDSVGLRAGKPVYGYDGWWGYDSMPIIKATNGSEYQTGTWAEEVIGKNETSKTADNSVTQYWLSKGMDGWRLDVANEVSDETWQHFRKSVKALDSDNVIIGEIWTDAVKYLMGDMYDSVMNYMFRGAAIAYAKGGNSADALNTLERLRERYPKEAFYAMMNLVDSHDTTRLLSYLDGIDDDRKQKEIAEAFPTYENTSDAAKQKQYLVALMQFTYAGAPTIYYGEELGMVGADDPDDRRAMIWGEGNENLVKWYAKLAAIRSSYSALRTGSVEPVYGTDKEILGYVRSDDSDIMLVLMNNSAADKSVTVNVAELGINAAELADVITGNSCSAAGGSVTVTVPVYNGVILTDKGHVKQVSVDEENLKPGFDPAYKIKAEERAVKVTGVSLKKTEITLQKGKTAKISKNVVVAPQNATNTAVKYKTSDKTVASVDKDGNVTANAKGTATITVTTKDGLFTSECKVTVGDQVQAAKIKLNKTKLSLKKGKTYTLKATVTPKDCTDKAVKWKSSKSSVVKVDANGKVTAKKAGTATITAATKNGLKATCKITVTDPATKVYLTPAMSIKKGSSVKLTASVFPKTTTDKLTWSTSNKKVVTVTKSGKIKGVKTGTATITVKTTSGKKATCKVTVVKSNKKSAGIKLSAKKLTLKQNATKQLKAALDKNATDKVTWSSSNKKVATVDKNGVVTAVKKGTVTITAKTSGGKKATCKVTVKVPATKVKLNKTKATVAKGRTLTLKATMTPSSSTDKLTWTSSNKKVATVDKNGKVKALKKGTATITVKTASGKKATCKITVK